MLESWHFVFESCSVIFINSLCLLAFIMVSTSNEIQITGWGWHNPASICFSLNQTHATHIPTTYKWCAYIIQIQVFGRGRSSGNHDPIILIHSTCRINSAAFPSSPLRFLFRSWSQRWNLLWRVFLWSWNMSGVYQGDALTFVILVQVWFVSHSARNRIPQIDAISVISGLPPTRSTLPSLMSPIGIL